MPVRDTPYQPLDIAVACEPEAGPIGAYAGASEPAVRGTEWHGAAYRFTALMFMNSGSFDHRW